MRQTIVANFRNLVDMAWIFIENVYHVQKSNPLQQNYPMDFLVAFLNLQRPILWIFEEVKKIWRSQSFQILLSNTDSPALYLHIDTDTLFNQVQEA